MGYLNACRFTYNGISSELYDLVVCFDGLEEDVATGLGREIIKGEVNMVRHKANQYGTVYNEVTPIEFMIMHPNGKEFTILESRSINKWLQTNTYCPLSFNNEKGTELYYKAICTQIVDKNYGGHIAKLVTFEADSPFAYERQITKVKSVTDRDIRIYNSSDDGIYYPILKLKANQENIIITNTSDKNQQMTLCIPSEYQNEDITINTALMQILDKDNVPIPLNKIGWTINTSENIGLQSSSFYWLRLVSEINRITVEGNCTLEILCEYPRKAGIL